MAISARKGRVYCRICVHVAKTESSWEVPEGKGNRTFSWVSMKPYDRLLTGERRRKSTVPGRTLDEEADSDRGRVLFCAPFRRLQNKAQVFSLEINAAVRSRLTHSLEVSSI